MAIANEIQTGFPVFSYNATKLSPREVARTFVPPAAFKVLRDANNAILVGPRGSGKTTLLKMLTSEALEAWVGGEGAESRERVQGVGVFIGVDAMWGEQISNVPSADVEAFGAAAYALHIGRAFVRTVLVRLGRIEAEGKVESRHLPLSLGRPDEADIAMRAARLFKLSSTGPSFRSLYQALGDQVAELGTYRYRLRGGGVLPDWAYLNPLAACAELAEMINQASGEPDRKWSLLFDELELAPSYVVQDILARLRGQEPLLQFKLSLSPILKSTRLLEGETGATHGQDLELIPLTTPERSDDFARDLFERLRLSVGLATNVSPRSALGESLFDTGDRGGRNRGRLDPYRKNSRLWNAMRWLREHDPSFSSYLEASGVDLDRLESLPAAVRASRIRKVRNLVVVRSHYRQGSRVNTQASRELYTGELTLLALADGNPRMSTILIREVLARVAEQQSLPLSRAAQAAAIDATATRFLALLHAQRGTQFGDRSVTMVNLIDAIGMALHARVVSDDFSADAAAGFFVDERFPERLRPLLVQAVNTGAIIHIPHPNSSQPVSESVLGRHYRLSYLLAPRYGLPVRKGKTIALWRLLERDSVLGSSSRVGRRRNPDRHQPMLLDLEEDDV
ncbi:hypothetical protein QF011_002864 [Curtobacterium flaccumfaciens]|nr:hypothetical protein [Curtobacterium flaccumfaciens]MDQ0540294.1 hypothetical protein [Curtobacterium flaccumfaciens]